MISRFVRTLIVGACLLALVGVILGAASLFASTDTGSPADWVEALATLLATIGAGVAVMFAYLANDRERERDVAQYEVRRADQKEREELRRKDERDRLDREQRAQAEKVSAWLAERPGKQIHLQLRNASDLPVYNVFTSISRVGFTASASLESFGVLPPGLTERYVRTARMSAFYTEAELANLGTDDIVWDIRVSTSFRDAAGLEWQRHDDGRLVQIEA